MRERYDFAFSGSLSGIELKNIRSWLVGYLREVRMRPIDFEEFCWASGLASSVLSQALVRLRGADPLDSFVHGRFD